MGGNYKTSVGSWVDCVNPFNNINHAYFKRIDFPSNQGFCPVCWYRMGNKPMIHIPFNERPKNSRIDSKPEKDTL